MPPTHRTGSWQASGWKLHRWTSLRTPSEAALPHPTEDCGPLTDDRCDGKPDRARHDDAPPGPRAGSMRRVLTGRDLTGDQELARDRTALPGAGGARRGTIAATEVPVPRRTAGTASPPTASGRG